MLRRPRTVDRGSWLGDFRGLASHILTFLYPLYDFIRAVGQRFLSFLAPLPLLPLPSHCTDSSSYIHLGAERCSGLPGKTNPPLPARASVNQNGRQATFCPVTGADVSRNPKPGIDPVLGGPIAPTCFGRGAPVRGPSIGGIGGAKNWNGHLSPGCRIGRTAFLAV